MTTLVKQEVCIFCNECRQTGINTKKIGVDIEGEKAKLREKGWVFEDDDIAFCPRCANDPEAQWRWHYKPKEVKNL